MRLITSEVLASFVALTASESDVVGAGLTRFNLNQCAL